MRPSLSYLICCCERTGSTLLGNALIDIGIAGRPLSYFNRVAPFNPRMQRILGTASDDDCYLERVIGAATTPNGVFGSKVHWEHFVNLISKLDRSFPTREGVPLDPVPERLRSHLPGLRYIWLTRRNAIARAISHYRVKKTGRWRFDTRYVTDDNGGEGEPPFDFDQIASFVRLGEFEDARWRQYFKEHEISALELIYEELVQDLEGTVLRVMEFLDIKVKGVRVPPPTVRQQSDALSREWEARYRQLCREDVKEGNAVGRGS